MVDFIPLLLEEELVLLNYSDGWYCYFNILLLINLYVFLKSLAASISSWYVGTIAVLILSV
jgi:hypothetical protein